MNRCGFPLQWPAGWPRTPPHQREPSRFMTGMYRAVSGLMSELSRLGVANHVITSDLPTRANGFPYGSAGDPGIAVWFVLAGQERVIACDRWATAAENIRAIGLSIEALRGMERWGAADIVTRAFQGFHALPESTGASVSTHGWRSTFREVAKSYDGDWIPRARALELIRAQYRREMHVVHPDKGGSTDRAAALNAAMNDAEGELLEPHTKETSSVE